MAASGYLLDTNAVSATRESYKQPHVAKFLRSLDPSTVFISVLTFGELRKGLTMRRRKAPNGVGALSQWVEQMELAYSGRAITVNSEIAKLWGELMGDRTRPAIDTLLAATAIVRDLTIITRNTTDFEGLPVKLFNPWLP